MSKMLGLASSLLLVFSVLIVLYAIYSLFSNVPEEDREYRDPLPLWLRILWPLIQFLDFFAFSRLNEKILQPTHDSLSKAGLLYLLTASQIMSLKTISIIICEAATLICFSALESPVSFPVMLVIGLIAYFLPLSFLRDIRIKREKEILKSLPNYL